MSNNDFHIEYRVYSMARGLTNGLRCKTIFILSMNPQNQLSGLDPKLKEAYERVMGTTIPPAPAPSGAGPASSPPTPQEPAASAPTTQTEPSSPPPQEPVSPPPIQEPTPPPVSPPQPPEPAAPPLQEPPQQPEPPPVPPAQPPVAPAEPAPSPVQSVQSTGFVANATKKGKLGGLKISPPILMAVGAALLILYFFFWIRIFNLSLF